MVGRICKTGGGSKVNKWSKNFDERPQRMGGFFTGENAMWPQRVWSIARGCRSHAVAVIDFFAAWSAVALTTNAFRMVRTTPKIAPFRRGTRPPSNNGSLDPPSNRRVDRFSRICRAQERDQQTDTETGTHSWPRYSVCSNRRPKKWRTVSVKKMAWQVVCVLFPVEHDGVEAVSLVWSAQDVDGGVERRLVIGFVRFAGDALHSFVDGKRVARRSNDNKAGVVRYTVQHRRQVGRQQHRLLTTQTAFTLNAVEHVRTRQWKRYFSLDPSSVIGIWSKDPVDMRRGNSTVYKGEKHYYFLFLSGDYRSLLTQLMNSSLTSQPSMGAGHYLARC